MTGRIFMGLPALALCLGGLDVAAEEGAPLAPATEAALRDASRDLPAATDRDSVVESLYEQLGPRARAPGEGGTPGEGDGDMRAYVGDRYVPVLMANYGQLFARLEAAGGGFSRCGAPEPLESGAEVPVALCAEQEGDAVRVAYLTRADDGGWRRNAVYSFRREGGDMTLHAIDLLLEPGGEAPAGGS